jgi:hypothetical protein
LFRPELKVSRRRPAETTDHDQELRVLSGADCTMGSGNPEDDNDKWDSEIPEAKWNKHKN